MVKHLDKRKIEQAFRRAEKALASGDKDALAGRFVPRAARTAKVSKDSDKDGPARKDSPSK